MRRWTRIATAAAVSALIAGGTASAASGSRPHHDLDDVRAATARFHSVAAAEQQGYDLLTDVHGIACIDMPGTGAMGVHWARTALVADPSIDPTQPEALVYAPMRDGTLRLAAVEYVVLQADWDAAHSRPPKLFGHRFNLTAAPNRFGLPAYYSLHAWAWKHNPAGRFAMWNPDVTCPSVPASAHAVHTH